MKANKALYKLIKDSEGFSSEPYIDRIAKNSPATIGYGFTYYPDGKKVTMKDSPLTLDQADSILAKLIEPIEKAISKLVTAAINQNQFNALVSFAYNLGLGILERSTLLKKINANPNDPSIKNEFMRFVYANNIKRNGLIKRRFAEAKLYFTEVE